MVDQWYFEIGDGHTYGPYSMEKLQKWASTGDLMPTHRVRHAETTEWIIAAYVPGLEQTLAATATAGPPSETDAADAAESKSFGSLVRRGLGRKKKETPSTKIGEDGRIVAGPAQPAEAVDVVALCDEILETAFERKASDIHIDPEENIVLVQLRVDGSLEPMRKLPKAIHNAVVGRYKVLSRMDIAERRMAQDGRFAQNLGPDERKIHFRTATLPTTHGERMTLRLLATETEQLTLNKLGMSPAAMKVFADYTGQRQGMILLSGPTGSGKSTTLYAALRHRLAHHPGRIITVEDPVEFDVVGVAQSEVDTADKLRFDTVLRNILRSDPDVIMIGEIRDHDSADVAIKASLTGHLVFSSIHTNSAAGVVTRFIDMGLQRYQVAATLKLCIAQRLVRKLCMHCREPRSLSAAEATIIGRPGAAGAQVHEPKGCPLCRDRGYRGRIGIFELLPIDDDLARLVVDGADEAGLIRRARERKIPSLRDDAAEKLLAGQTSYSELVTVSAW
jgi:type II secretory ATPase GspE/PulE/Tfp pilus assembly ATPase PilB-like protein